VDKHFIRRCPHTARQTHCISITSESQYDIQIHSFIHSSITLHPSLGPGLFFSFVIMFTQSVGLLGRVIIPSQGRYLHTGQHKHRINAHIYIHALSRIQTQDPSVRASEDSSCLRPRGHCDRQDVQIAGNITALISYQKHMRIIHKHKLILVLEIVHGT
jgi:hypothetical protein